MLLQESKILVKDEGAGEVRRIASKAKHGKLVPSVEYDEDYILDT